MARGEDELYVAFALDTRERVFEYSLRSSDAGGGIGTREYETEFVSPSHPRRSPNDHQRKKEYTFLGPNNNSRIPLVHITSYSFFFQRFDES